jgi:hypothetical protein
MITDAFARLTSQSLEVQVHPDLIPQSAVFPVVVYTLVSRPSFQGVTGRLPFEVVRLQIDVYGETLNEVETLGDGLLALWRATTGEIEGLEGESINKAYPDDGYTIDFLNDGVRPLWRLECDLMIEVIRSS